MFSNRCPYCDHGNPADSKFCGACGGALHLAPCPNCGAVADVTATVCYQCRAPLRGGGAAGEAPSEPVVDLLRRLAAGGDFPPATQVASRTETEAPAPRAAEGSYPRAADIPSRLAARVAFPRGTEAGAAPAAELPTAPAAEAHTPHAAEVLPPPAAEVADESSSSPAAAETSNSSPRRSPRIIVGTAAAVLAAIAVLGYYFHFRERSPGETAQPPAVSSEEKAIKAPSQAIGKAGGRTPTHPEGCTEAGAALGLCAPKTVQKKEAKTDPALRAANTRSQATDSGKTDGQAPPRPQACTAAVAALGLCPPKPTQRKE